MARLPGSEADGGVQGRPLRKTPGNRLLRRATLRPVLAGLWGWAMISLVEQFGTYRLAILRDGAHHGMVERGMAYAQQLAPADLRELADRMEEAPKCRSRS